MSVPKLQDLKIANAELTSILDDAVIGIPVLDLSATEVSQLSFAVRDTDYKLLASGLLSAGTIITYAELSFSIATVETEENYVIRITARTSGIQRMKAAKDKTAVSNLSPTEFITQRAEAAGLTVVAQPSAKRPHITKSQRQGEDPESDWDAFRRLARELGYFLFEAKGVLYFGQPTWLIENAATVWTEEQLDLIALPNFRRSVDDPESPVTVTVEAPPSTASAVRPGDVLRLSNTPTFNGDYIIVAVPLVFADATTPITISAMTPTDPDPQSAAEAAAFNPLGGITFGDVNFDPVVAPAQPVVRSWIWPVKQGKVFREYGVRTPTFGGAGTNTGSTISKGLDIAVPLNAPIYAAHDGHVTFFGPIASLGEIGLVIEWRTNAKFATYASVYVFGPKAADGAIKPRGTATHANYGISRGEVIGYLSGGRKFLHFEVRKLSGLTSLGTTVDPRSFMPTSNPPDVPVSQLLV